MDWIYVFGNHYQQVEVNARSGVPVKDRRGVEWSLGKSDTEGVTVRIGLADTEKRSEK